MKLIGGIIICGVLQLYGLALIVVLFGNNLKFFCFVTAGAQFLENFYNTFYYC